MTASAFLIVDPKVMTILEERGIGIEDAEKTIEHGENTGNVFKNRATGHLLASLRASTTTFWVEYCPKPTSYRIFTAYSHRMEILEGFNMPGKTRGEIADWFCGKCNRALEWTGVKLKYLNETFAVELPTCPLCRRALVTEKDATEKMALAEQMLEDK